MRAPALLVSGLMLLIGPAGYAAAPTPPAVEKRAQYLKGLDLRRHGKLQEAVRAFQSALAVDPEFVEAHRQIQEVRIAIGQRADVLASYRRELEQAPGSPLAHYLYGRCLEDHAEALREFRRAIQLDPKFIWGYVGVTTESVRLRLPDQALATVSQARAIDPHHPMLVLKQGQIFVSLGQPEKAAPCFQALLEDPEYGLNALLELGDLAYSTQQYTRAKEYYEKASRLTDTPAILHYRLGYIYDVIDKRYDRALEQYAACAKIDPHFATALSNAGGLYQWQKKDLSRAEKQYLLACAADTKDVMPRRRLADLYLEQDKLEEALKYANEWRRIDPLDSAAQLEVGVVLAHQKKYYAAVEAFETSYRLDPAPYPNLFNIGLSYNKAGEYEKALLAYRQLQQKHPQNPQQDFLSRQTAHLQKVIAGLTVAVDSVGARPQAVRRGGVVAVVMHYTVGGTGEDRLLLTEERRIQMGETVVGRPLVHYRYPYDGGYTTSVPLTVPWSAKPGTYVVSGWINVCGVVAENMGAFRVE